MNYLTGLAVVLTIIASSGAASAAEESPVPSGAQLTLETAKAVALENSPTIASAVERVNQARESVIQAKAAFFPAIDYAASWNHTHDRSDRFDDNQYASSLSATLVLFNGFLNKYSLLAARWEARRSQEVLRESRSLLVRTVASGYLNVQLAREAITIARSDMDYNQRLADEAQAKQDAGKGSLSDVLHFQTSVNSARASLISAELELAQARYGLAALMGLPGSRLPDGVTLADLTIEPDAVPLPTDMDALIFQALTRRPDLRQAAYSIDIAESGVESARSGNYPVLSLKGSYGSAGPWETVSEASEQNGAVGLSLSFNLFSGGATRSRIAGALSRKRELERTLEAERLTAVSEIRSAAEALASAKQQLRLQKENTELVRQTRDLVETEYRAGQASLVRLIEAQNALIRSLGSLANARVSLVLAREQLLYVRGENLETAGRE